MKKIWPYLSVYLSVFIVIFLVGLLLNLSGEGRTICMTDTWCPDRKEEALLLAIIFTLPFLAITVFLMHGLPPIAHWIWKYPQHSFAGIFFFLAISPIVLLVVDPESILPIQKKLAHAAIAADLFFGGATIAFANSIPANERHSAAKKRKPYGLLLLLGLFVCMGLTVAAVSDWS